MYVGRVDHATHPFGLATPSGFISTTGVGGLTLGGGIGYLSRTLGLTIDNLLGVDMVLADGSFGWQAPRSMPTCSGQYVVVVATLASSPRSCSNYTHQYGLWGSDALADRTGSRRPEVLARIHHASP